MTMTTEMYWDCECDDKYIQKSTKEMCEKCGAYRDEMPDSRVNEVEEGIYFGE